MKRELPKYKNCSVVNTTDQLGDARPTSPSRRSRSRTPGSTPSSRPTSRHPSGVLVNQLRQNGVTIPFLGGASLNLAVTRARSRASSNLCASDDCVPELEKDKTAKKFVKAYNAKYGYAAELRLGAGLRRVPHGWRTPSKRLVTTRPRSSRRWPAPNYDGVCDFINDKNNVLAQSVTVYKYKARPTRRRCSSRVRARLRPERRVGCRNHGGQRRPDDHGRSLTSTHTRLSVLGPGIRPGPESRPARAHGWTRTSPVLRRRAAHRLGCAHRVLRAHPRRPRRTRRPGRARGRRR